jgi:antitoxin Phd
MKLDHMHIWPVQDAKARFSDLLDTCVTDGPQVVSHRGAETAVLVPIEEWRHLQLADAPRADIAVPPRGQLGRRALPSFD